MSAKPRHLWLSQVLARLAPFVTKYCACQYPGCVVRNRIDPQAGRSGVRMVEPMRMLTRRDHRGRRVRHRKKRRRVPRIPRVAGSSQRKPVPHNGFGRRRTGCPLSRGRTRHQSVRPRRGRQIASRDRRRHDRERLAKSRTSDAPGSRCRAAPRRGVGTAWGADDPAITLARGCHRTALPLTRYHSLPRQTRSNGNRQARGAINWWIALGPHESRS